MIKNCIFCGLPLKKRGSKSKEHILRKSWLDALGHGKTQIYLDRVNRAGIIIDQQNIIANSLLSGKVCGKCNNGWMNDLDLAVEHIILSIASRQYGYQYLLSNLTASDKKNLSRWLLKTACTFLYTDTEDRIHIPSSIVKSIKNDTYLPKGFFSFIGFNPSTDNSKNIEVSSLDVWHFFNDDEKSRMERIGHLKFGVLYDNVIFGCAYIDWPNPLFVGVPNIHYPLLCKSSSFQYAIYLNYPSNYLPTFVFPSALNVFLCALDVRLHDAKPAQYTVNIATIKEVLKEEHCETDDTAFHIAQTKYNAGDFAGVVALHSQYDKSPTFEFAHILVWSYMLLGKAMIIQARLRTDDDAACLVAEAFEKFKAAHELQYETATVLVIWGDALLECAKYIKAMNTECLLLEAYDKYSAAISVQPTMYNALYNWGVALLEHAQRKTGDEAHKMLMEACEKFEAALDVQPDMSDALSSWATALLRRAHAKKGCEFENLLAEAIDKYNCALEIKPNEFSYLYNLGNALKDYGNSKNAEEADALLSEAVNKYEAAIKLVPNAWFVLDNWGLTLMDKAKRKDGTELRRLLIEAKDIFLRAESVSPGNSAYNLACVYALLGDVTQCLEYLRRLERLNRLPSKEHLLKDNDLAEVRNEARFASFIDGLKH